MGLYGSEGRTDEIIVTGPAYQCLSVPSVTLSAVVRFEPNSADVAQLGTEP